MSHREDLNDLVKAFLVVLRQTFELYRKERISEIDLIGNLSGENPIFWDYGRIEDKQLNAAISFCDSFFDALWHGARDVNGIPIDEAETLVAYVIDVLSKGQEIRDERVLSYYCGKSKRQPLRREKEK